MGRGTSGDEYSNETNGTVVAAAGRGRPPPALCFDRITFPKIEALRHTYTKDKERGMRALRWRSWTMMSGTLDPSPWPNMATGGGWESDVLATHNLKHNLFCDCCFATVNSKCV